MRQSFKNLSLLRRVHIGLFVLFASSALLLGLNTYSKNRSLISRVQQQIVVLHFVSMQGLENFHKKYLDGIYTPEESKAAALTALSSVDLHELGYATVVSRDGTFLLHPTKRGQKLDYFLWDDERLSLEQVIARVQGAGLIMDYEGGVGDKKVGRIAFFEPWGWLVFYGRYQDDIMHLLLKDVALDALGAGIFLAVLAMVLLHIRTAVLVPLARCVEHVNRIVGLEASPISQSEIRTLGGFTDSIVSLTTALKETIRRTKKVEKTLKDNQRLLFEVLNNSAIAISIKDKHLNYLRVNKAFEQFIAGEDADQEHGPGYPPRTTSAAAQSVAAAVKKFETHVQQYNRPIAKELVVQGGDRELSWLVSSFPIFDSRNEFYAVCTMSTNISPLKKNEKQIRIINGKLRKRTEELQNFIHVISHDLKSPLKNIGNCCQLLRDEYGERLDETAALYLEHAINNAQKMVRLISELLRYSRAAKLTSMKKEFDSTRAVRTAVAAAVTLQDRPHVSLQYGKLPHVYANEVTLAQVFQNLIDNAVKHALPAHRSVSIAIEATLAEGYWEFSVTDDGPGIDAKYAEVIFKIFQKLELRKTDDDSSGTGLAICKTIISQHGGEIWLDIDYKKGARFKFTLPLRHSPSLDFVPEPLEEA